MVQCKAVVWKGQVDNLVQCIRILGGDPQVHGTEVTVEYTGEKELAMMDLFSHYTNHEIHFKHQEAPA